MPENLNLGTTSNKKEEESAEGARRDVLDEVERAKKEEEKAQIMFLRAEEALARRRAKAEGEDINRGPELRDTSGKDKSGSGFLGRRTDA